MRDWILSFFQTAELEKWIPSNRHKPPRTSYAGYRTCTTVLDDNLLDKVRTRCVAVEQGIPYIVHLYFIHFREQIMWLPNLFDYKNH